MKELDLGPILFSAIRNLSLYYLHCDMVSLSSPRNREGDSKKGRLPMRAASFINRRWLTVTGRQSV